MARPSSITIPINSDALKNIIKAKGHNISDLGAPDLLDVSRQTINTWLQLGNIPPRKLSILGQKLNLTPSEVDLISSPVSAQDTQVRFRTNRNVATNKDVEDKVLKLAKDYFNLSELFSVKLSTSRTSISIDEESPAEMANKILKILSLERRQLSLESVIKALEEINIHVLFYDFGKLFKDSDAQAVCVIDNKSSVIFINAEECLEDVLWRIFHELSHIFMKSKEGTTKTEEVFCNSTANEVLTPTSFFQEHAADLKKVLSRSITELPTRVEQIASKLNSSFMGVILALNTNKIIDKRQFGYLMKIYHLKKDQRKKVVDILHPNEEQNPFLFWKDLFNNPEYYKFLTLQELVKAGLINGTLSTERAAEILKIDSMTTQQLEQFWKDEYAGTAHN